MRTIKTDRIISESEKRINMSLSFELSEFLKVKKIDPNFKKFIRKKIDWRSKLYKKLFIFNSKECVKKRIKNLNAIIY